MRIHQNGPVPFVLIMSIAFYAVATDPTAVSNDALKKRLAEWKVELPIVRDLEAFGDKAFHIELQPTITVLENSPP